MLFLVHPIDGARGVIMIYGQPNKIWEPIKKNKYVQNPVVEVIQINLRAYTLSIYVRQMCTYSIYLHYTVDVKKKKNMEKSNIFYTRISIMTKLLCRNA